MFYYYEKAGKLLASERRDLPYLKAEPAPGTPICYLVAVSYTHLTLPTKLEV